MSWAEGKLSVFVCFALACLFAEGLAWPRIFFVRRKPA
jgi:hypothetical protein